MGFFKTSLPVIVTRKSALGGCGPWSGKGKLDTSHLNLSDLPGPSRSKFPSASHLLDFLYYIDC